MVWGFVVVDSRLVMEKTVCGFDAVDIETC
jgi:hypothetical protein